MNQATLLAVGMLPPPLGGQALMFQRAIEALPQNYRLDVIDAQIQRSLAELGMFLWRKVLRFIALFGRRVVPCVWKPNHDVLYYCLSSGSMLGLIKDLCFLTVLRPKARRTIYHLHGAGGITLLLKSNFMFRAWARFVLFKPDLVLRPPSDLREGLLCETKSEVVIPNGVEDPLTLFPHLVDVRPDEKLHLTFIGLVTAEKGVFDLIEVARMLRGRGHCFVLSIVGEGTAAEIDQLNSLIQRYHLKGYVRLTGVLAGEQKFLLLRRSTLFLFPTYFRSETQPTVIMEALAVGVPVVAYDWRGVGTMIEQGENGYVVPVHDVDAFCRTVERVLVEDRLDVMRKAARRIFLERFTLDRHVAALLNAFAPLTTIDGKQAVRRVAAP